MTLVALILAFMGEKMSKAVKGLLIFSAIILFAVSIAYLYYMWGIAALSGSCNLAMEVVKGNAKILEDVNADPDIKEVV